MSGVGARRARAAARRAGPWSGAVSGIGPAERRVVGRIAERDGLRRAAIVGEQAAAGERVQRGEQQAGGTFSRSLGTLPATSLPKMFSPLLSMTAVDVGAGTCRRRIARNDAVGQRQIQRRNAADDPAAACRPRCCR